MVFWYWGVMVVLAVVGKVLLGLLPSSAFVACYTILIIASVLVALVAQVDALRFMRNRLVHADSTSIDSSSTRVKV